MTESPGCTILRWLAWLFSCPRQPPVTRFLLFSIGPGTATPAAPPTLPPGVDIMAKGDVGQYSLLTLTPLRSDRTPGVTDVVTLEHYSVDDPALAEIVEHEGNFYAHLLAQGAVTVKVRPDVDPGPDQRFLEAFGQIVINDPTDDTTILELAIGDAIPELPVTPPVEPEAA